MDLLSYVLGDFGVRYDDLPLELHHARCTTWLILLALLHSTALSRCSEQVSLRSRIEKVVKGWLLPFRPVLTMYSTHLFSGCQHADRRSPNIQLVSMGTVSTHNEAACESVSHLGTRHDVG